MTDLRELLDTAAGEPATPTPDVVSSDLRRGRVALRRRRGLLGGSALVLAGAAVAVGLAVVPHLGGDGTTRQTVIAPAGSSANPGVDLVPWDAGATPWGVNWTKIAVTPDWASAYSVLYAAIAARTCN